MFDFLNKINNKRKNPFANVPARDLEGELWVVAGKKLGERWRLVDEGDQFLIGRHLKNTDDISFDNTASTISKNHCVVRKTAKGFELEDLGSANGTSLNKKKIKGATEIISGDEITVGLNEATFRFTVININSTDPGSS